MPATGKKLIKVQAFQITAEHFRDEKPVPEWMEGRAYLTEWDGVCGRIGIVDAGSFWIVNPGDWFIHLNPGFIVCSARIFQDLYEAI